MFKTNYKKLAAEIINQMEGFKKEIVNSVAEKLAKEILGESGAKEKLLDAVIEKGVIKQITDGYFTGPFGRVTKEVKIVDVIAEKVAYSLKEDAYKLRKAEVLEQIKSRDIVKIMEEKLKQEAKEAVQEYLK